MARAKPKLRRRTLDLYEDIVRGLAPLGQGQQRVDRDKGVIYGVKILGRESANDRRYTDEAIQEAYRAKIYEGLAVYVDHPAKPGDPRPVRSKFGRLVNVRLHEGEPYGDLEYLKAHPEAALITEAAERMPEQFGLSHNAKGEGENDADGTFVVRRIIEARSCDVVTEPATTNGFFEQRGKRHMAIKIKQLFENSWKKYAKKTSKRPRLAAVMKALVEDDAYDVMGDDAEGVEEAPADHEEALKGGFEASVAAIVKKCLDGEEEPKDSIKKIGELLKAHDKLTGGDDAEEDDMEEEEEPDEGGKKDDDKGEKETEEQKRLKQLERKDKARDLCEDMGVVCDKVLLEALTGMADEKAMKRLLEREKGKGGGNRNAPRSGATGSGKQTQAALEGVDTPEGMLAAFLG